MANKKGQDVDKHLFESTTAPDQAANPSEAPASDNVILKPITGMLNEIELAEFESILAKYPGLKKGHLIRHIITNWLRDYKAGKVEIPLQKSFTLKE